MAFLVVLVVTERVGHEGWAQSSRLGLFILPSRSF